MMRLVAVALAFTAVAIATFAAPVDYIREIKPILAENCYRCHGASQQKGEMRMDTAALALKGGETGPGYVPGKSANSLIVQAIKGTHDQISRMPYKKPPLSDAQIELIARWIDEGAKAPSDEKPENKVHWAFVKPLRPKLPEVSQKAWARNPIDHFILARFEEKSIKPAPEADRVTLIRRLCLDLTGLPPSISEVDSFVNDKSPDAYDRLVERLLASSHYGERWGRHWLDVARYADSNGYSIDAPRSIWKYRDWVINALNRDLPFDQFSIEQLAGDLLPNATLEQKIATGFNRNTQINQEGGIDPEQFRVESVMDRVNTTATAFLGLTIACAQCHDHKFDPITQKEYYQFYAFFNNTINDGHGKGAPEGMLEIAGEQEPTESLEKDLEEAEADLDRYLDTKGSELVKWEQALTDEENLKFKPDVRAALKIPFSERSKKQKRIVYAAFRSDDAEFKQRNTKLSRLEKRQPKPITTLVMVEEKEPRESVVFIKGDFTRRGKKVVPGTPAILHPVAHDVRRGHFSNQPSAGPSPQPADAVQPNQSAKESASESQAPKLLSDGSHALPPPGAADEVSRSNSSSLGQGEGDSSFSGRQLTRLDLAHWITDPENPLTARVIVNRIWQRYFGKGLVETENDFGTQGIPPTHPELLDWLATEFMRPSDKAAKPWSFKHIHRLIVGSATYRQSSKIRNDLANIDANNKLLARQNRLRLDSEIVRDVGLTASGLLTDKIGGPSVFPPQPAGVMTLGQVKREWKPSTGPDRYRRGMYTFFWRATPHPALSVFDSPDAFSTCTRRIRSNTPLQSLTLLNDEAFVEFSQAMAQRILKEPAASDTERIERAFRLCLSRPPSGGEKQRLLELLNAETVALQKSPDDIKSLIAQNFTKSASETQNFSGPEKRAQAVPSPEGEGQGEGVSNAAGSRFTPLDLAAWTTVARVLLNLDETITRE